MALIWLACTIFVAVFLLAQIPEVYQDLTLGFAFVAVVLLWLAP